MCLLWRHVYLGLLPIFLLHFLFMVLLSCMSCLHILEIKPLSVASFADPSSQPVRCLFIFCMASFAVQTLVSLMRSHLLIFAFISIALGDWPKKTLAWFMSENVLPLISSRTCMVSRLMSLSQFELFFVVRGCVLTSLIYLRLFNFPNTTCWRDSLFSHCLFLPPLSNINWP